MSNHLISPNLDIREYPIREYPVLRAQWSQDIRREDIFEAIAITAASLSYTNSDIKDFRTRQQKEDEEIELLRNNRKFTNCIMELEIGELI